MSAKHQNSNHPQGAEPHAPGAVDTRASASADPAPDAGETTQTVDSDLQAAREEAKATFAQYQRLAADFENYKRRSRQDLADRTQYANEELVRKLLPILDNFKRALDHAPENIDPSWFEGIKLVARQFEETLQAQGLSTIPAVGQPFDPAQHEAIAREETDEHQEGTVVEEMRPGYRLHNRVLRPTLVKVAHPRALKS
ncbi:MAG TPA: nucleotide exchange factor GrpE [Candidatus Dormibacteraeota bacterium]|nr:nucleotide exchange factor GrpE [Candidatus Dormibacteraeota bacterium]